MNGKREAGLWAGAAGWGEAGGMGDRGGERGSVLERGKWTKGSGLIVLRSAKLIYLLMQTPHPKPFTESFPRQPKL